MGDSHKQCDNVENQDLDLKESNPHTLIPDDAKAFSLKYQCKDLQKYNVPFDSVFESLHGCIIVFDRHCNHLYANPAALDYVGLPYEKVVGANITDVWSNDPDFAKRWTGRIKEAFKTGKPSRFEDSDTVPGHPVYSESVILPIRHPDEEIFAVGMIYRDITELKTSQERYKRLAEATFDGIIIHETSRIIDVNQQFADMFGYSREDIFKIDRMNLFAPESRDMAKKKIAAEFEGIYEAVGLKKDGARFPVEVRAKQSHLDGKNVRIAMCRDLCEQKAIERQIIESERRYRELYDNARVALFRTAMDGTLLHCNKACLPFFGRPVDEDLDNFINKINVSDRHVDPARRQKFIDILKKHKRVDQFEAELKRSDGTTFWASISAEFFPETGCIEGSIEDITATKTLTKAEKKVLGHLMQGRSNKEIARQLRRSVRTIEDHRAHIMQKLGVDNLVDLTQKALNLTNHYIDK